MVFSYVFGVEKVNYGNIVLRTDLVTRDRYNTGILRISVDVTCH